MKLILELAPQEIVFRFGRPFVKFLMFDIFPRDQRYILRVDMPWAERSFMMSAIDDIADQIQRDGARIAHLALFKSRSWEEEKQTVRARLLA